MQNDNPRLPGYLKKFQQTRLTTLPDKLATEHPAELLYVDLPGGHRLPSERVIAFDLAAHRQPDPLQDESAFVCKWSRPVTEIKDAGHFTCIAKEAFKDELVKWIDAQWQVIARQPSRDHDSANDIGPFCPCQGVLRSA